MTTVAIKYRAATHTVPAGTVDKIKVALEDLTGIAVAEMQLIHRGKVLQDGSAPPPGSKLMLMRSAAKVQDARPVSIRDIITGRCATVDVPPSINHDDLAALAVRVLGCPSDGGACLRLYLAHVSSLMRIDLALSDYLSPTSAGDGASVADDAPIIYLVPGMPGLRLDAAASAEAVAEAARFELEATALARAQIEEQMEAELLRHAAPALLPPSILDVVSGESAEKASPSDSQEISDSCSELPSSSSATAPSAASFVPARIRTGLMASMEDVEVVQVPMQALACMQAFDEYDAEMRTFSELPAEEARALMVAAEEARLEERCTMLVSTLEPTSPTLDAAAVARPPTPVGLPSCGWREGMSSAGMAQGLAPGLWSSSWSCRAFGDDVSDEVGEGSAAGSKCRLVSDAADVGVAMTTPKHTHKGRQRCKTCACRLPLTASVTAACACGELFCPAHMHAHECSFDFRTPEQRKLAKGNPKCEHSKLKRL